MSNATKTIASESYFVNLVAAGKAGTGIEALIGLGLAEDLGTNSGEAPELVEGEILSFNDATTVEWWIKTTKVRGTATDMLYTVAHSSQKGEFKFPIWLTRMSRAFAAQDGQRAIENAKTFSDPNWVKWHDMDHDGLRLEALCGRSFKVHVHEIWIEKKDKTFRKKKVYTFEEVEETPKPSRSRK